MFAIQYTDYFTKSCENTQNDLTLFNLNTLDESYSSLVLNCVSYNMYDQTDL